MRINVEAKTLAIRAAKVLIAIGILLFVVSVYQGLQQKKQAERQKRITVTEQSVSAAQANADGAIANYSALKDENIQKQKQATRTAVIDAEAELQNDEEIAFAWIELVKRAKAFNAKAKGTAGGASNE